MPDDIVILLGYYKMSREQAAEELADPSETIQALLDGYHMGYGDGRKDWAVEVDHAQLEMHYSEAIDWIAALQKWIVRQGFEVPSWAKVNE